MKGIVLGFLLAPLPTALFQSIVVGIWPKPGQGVFEHPLSMLVAMCLLFYLIELIVGVPLYFAARKRLPRSPSTYGLAGAAIVLLPIVAALGMAAAKGTLSAYAIVYNLVLFAVGGFLAGVIFWRMTKPQRAADDLSQTFA